MLFAIGLLRSLRERSLQHNKYLYICLIDYKNAFDRVNWYKLMRALVRLGDDCRDRRLICKSYATIGCRKIKQHAIRTLPIGPSSSTWLITVPIAIYIQYLIEEALENIEDGVKVNGVVVKSMRFAYDQAMVSKSNTELQRIREALNTSV